MDLNRSVEILERLYHEGKLFNTSDLACAYLNRGRICWVLASFDEEAILDFSRGIMILERLYNERKLFDVNILALGKAYMNRGLLYAAKTDYKKAILDYNRSIEMQERMNSENKLYDERDLASVYCNMGIALYNLGNAKDAISNSVNALRMFKRLFVNRHDLQKDYFDCLGWTISMVDIKKDLNVYANILKEFLFPMLDLEKTEAAEAVQNAILEHLNLNKKI